VLFVNGGSAVRPNPKVAGISVAFAGESATRGMMHQAMAAENTEFERHRLLPGKRAWDPRRCRWRPYQAYACGASPGPGQIRSSRATTSASNCTVSAPRSDCSSSIVVAPTIVVETTVLRSSQASATSAGFAPSFRRSPS
jgi:hypothetical protein